MFHLRALHLLYHLLLIVLSNHDGVQGRKTIGHVSADGLVHFNQQEFSTYLGTEQGADVDKPAKATPQSTPHDSTLLMRKGNIYVDAYARQKQLEVGTDGGKPRRNNSSSKSKSISYDVEAEHSPRTSRVLTSIFNSDRVVSDGMAPALQHISAHSKMSPGVTSSNLKGRVLRKHLLSIRSLQLDSILQFGAPLGFVGTLWIFITILAVATIASCTIQKKQSFECTSVVVAQNDVNGQEAIKQMVAALGGPPSLVVAHSASPDGLTNTVASLAQSAFCSASTVIGCTSFQGTMTNGHHNSDEGSLFAVRDPAGCYVSVACRVENDKDFNSWRDAGVHVATEALSASRWSRSSRDNSDLPLVMVHATPGFEEAVIEGIASVLPGSIVFGGSAAHLEFDSTRWKVAAGLEVLPAGAIALALLWPSVAYAVSFDCVHHPPFSHGKQAVASKLASHGRQVLTLGDEPAAVVYKKWCDEEQQERVRRKVSFGVDIAAQSQGVDSITTLHPLARAIASDDGERHFLPLHPHSFKYSDGSLGLFAAASEGDVLYLLSGSREGLVREMRAAIVRAREKNSGLSGPKSGNVAGALVICCAGLAAELNRASMLVDLPQELYIALDSRPLWIQNACKAIPMPWVQSMWKGLQQPSLHGFYAYGEQGPLISSKANNHANLMLSALIFYRD